ncbi:unnamed protein product [Linum tenue]|uniref:Uncharacterized protein n=1 Tax=Linum tenue TaxID=586396 RepID=A0AAV0K331_9ROSI|nr:unnamed protein product [Linum tenue]
MITTTPTRLEFAPPPLPSPPAAISAEMGLALVDSKLYAFGGNDFNTSPNGIDDSDDDGFPYRKYPRDLYVCDLGTDPDIQKQPLEFKQYAGRLKGPKVKPIHVPYKDDKIFILSSAYNPWSFRGPNPDLTSLLLVRRERHRPFDTILVKFMSNASASYADLLQQEHKIRELCALSELASRLPSDCLYGDAMVVPFGDGDVYCLFLWWGLNPFQMKNQFKVYKFKLVDDNGGCEILGARRVFGEGAGLLSHVKSLHRILSIVCLCKVLSSSLVLTSWEILARRSQGNVIAGLQNFQGYLWRIGHAACS